MKKYFVKISVCIVLALTTLTFFAFIQSSQKTSSEGFVTVKVIESGNPMAGYKSKIIIADAKTIIKTIPLETFSPKSGMIESNMMVVNATLDEMKGQGYKLVSTSAMGEGILIVNYLFEK